MDFIGKAILVEDRKLFQFKVGRLYGHRFATRRQAMDEVIDVDDVLQPT
jgi:hypothetical protein